MLYFIIFTPSFLSSQNSITFLQCCKTWINVVGTRPPNELRSLFSPPECTMISYETFEEKLLKEMENLKIIDISDAHK